MTLTTQSPMTIEEYLNYDDGTDTRYELVDGVLVEMPVESWNSSTISIYLLTQLLAFVPYYLIRHKDTEVAVNSTQAKARIPDLMVVSEATSIQMSGQKGLIPLNTEAPRLVVEVVSPGKPGDENYHRDYVAKRQEYSDRGIPEYWIIDPSGSVVKICTLVEGQYHDTEFRGSVLIFSPTFPDLKLTVDQILNAGQ
jgi:Uma2 family endonuclease